jgi:hypothetical protein
MIFQEKDRPFKNSTPSLFFINSPFQALCMLEAIYEYNIKDYKVYLVLYDDVRNVQLKKLLEENNIHFEIIDGKKDRLWKYFTLLFSIKKTPYKRAYIGYYNTDSFFYYAIKYVSYNADVVYLDDGIATVSLLNGQYKRTLGGRFVFGIFRLAAYLKKISLDNLYTIYSGISNDAYNIRICDFQRLKLMSKERKHKDVVFIGTNSPLYSKANNITIEEYERGLDIYLGKIKRIHSNETIYYIPHGRDMSPIPSNLCAKHDIVFNKVDTTVELYILRQDNFPVAVYGLTSSALYNIKKMIPSCDVFNIDLSSILSTHNTTRMEKLIDYYSSIGIKTI